MAAKRNPYLRPFSGEPFRYSPVMPGIETRSGRYLVMTEDREAGRICLDVAETEQAADIIRSRLSQHVTKPLRQKCWIEVR